jgi:hypothetical protein
MTVKVIRDDDIIVRLPVASGKSLAPLRASLLGRYERLLR